MSTFYKTISLSPEIASAMTKASRALGVSGNAYVEQAVARCIALDSDRIALANDESSAEIARLAKSANDLIQLAHRIDNSR